MNKNSRRIIYIIILIAIFIYSFIGSKGEGVESLDIPIGIGIDLYGKDEYKVPLSVYEITFTGDVTSRVISGESSSIGGTRNNRQEKANKRFILGQERVYILSEAYAESGIRTVIDILTNNPTVSDKSPAVIYKGTSEELLRHEMKGYASPAEYIGEMIKSSPFNNFFSPQFSIMDIIVRVDAEGRNVVLPYIELKENGPQITGLALFKGDKMIGKTNIEEARVINLLKFNGGKGIITIEKVPNKYIDFYAQSKRKVKCSKIDGKYKFDITIELNGSIVSNEMYPNLNKDPKELKKFTKEVEDSVKKMCTEYINKVKYEYETDILSLGREAAGKYGKDTGVDWNKVVSESIIEVNVKATVKDEGRGMY